MIGAVFRKEDIFGKAPGLGCLRQDAQALGKEQACLAAVTLFAQRADPLDQIVGKGGYLAGQGTMLR